MPRASRADAARHHDEVIKAASRLFRERGVASVSVPDVMGEVGLTKGGFYKHFESKDDLVAAAVEAAFGEHFERLEGMSDRSGRDRDETRRAFVDFCLSSAHRDDPANGCPSALASAMAHADPGGPSRAAFIEGTRTLLRELAEKAGGDGVDRHSQEERILGDLATVVGGLLLARATAGDPISDAFLSAARRRLA
ncbi:MAG TPA: TetR/AcrR family transcriptional regulator [Pseudonocardia sp.]|jgi:TetR/AcrR family transcriptional repressor of nem operon|nr:TetR/AcrR family transcriptional regulator [Pseudonocardia sp.]